MSLLARATKTMSSSATFARSRRPAASSPTLRMSWLRMTSSVGVAAVVASVLNGLTGHEVLVHNRGGNLFVEWEEETGSVFVTAPVTYLFTGIYDGTIES